MARAHAILSELQPQVGILDTIRTVLPDDAILVPDITQLGYVSQMYYPVYQPRTYLSASYMGTLDYAFPTALGAKVAEPDRAVVALCGDGGFLFNSQELATAVQYGINIVIVIFNDSADGNSLRDQHIRFGGRVIATELHNPDFAKLAQTYGADGEKLKGPQHLAPALAAALRNRCPTLLEVPVEAMPSPWTLPSVQLG